MKKKTETMNIASAETPKGEQLIERDEVENTPFVIITMNKESFGTFGKYRITESYHTKQQCRAELLNMNWNNVVKIMSLVHEVLSEINKK
ncbi:MAG: hypothetical protein [Microviridae sp.]|nr:MAG: hypothetical protein [Microviridae sp.]